MGKIQGYDYTFIKDQVANVPILSVLKQKFYVFKKLKIKQY